MSIIINFNFHTLITGIQQIISLPDPGNNVNLSAFQVTTTNAISAVAPVNPANLVRVSNITSAGFPFNTPLPANAYTFNPPSSAYGTNPLLDTFSVLQINTALAKIEPGFSRLAVTYNYGASGQLSATSYFDVPFYEGWNVTDRELNNLVDYAENGVGFLLNQSNLTTLRLNYMLSKALWKGISVSGKLTWTPATAGLKTGMLK